MCAFQESASTKQTKKNKTEDKEQADATAEGKRKVKKVKKNKAAAEEEEEEIPQLVPIETPVKKPKLEVSTFHSCSSWREPQQMISGFVFLASLTFPLFFVEAVQKEEAGESPQTRSGEERNKSSEQTDQEDRLQSKKKST